MKVLEVYKKALPLHTQFRTTLISAVLIGIWCNGNTADSGPAFSGSSPDTPTYKMAVE